MVLRVRPNCSVTENKDAILCLSCSTLLMNPQITPSSKLVLHRNVSFPAHDKHGTKQ